jgi:diguanylate cyclase (GGDEF)-like protein
MRKKSTLKLGICSPGRGPSQQVNSVAIRARLKFRWWASITCSMRPSRPPVRRIPRTYVVPLLVIVAAAAAFGVITVLHSRVDADRRAQTTLARTRADIEEIGGLPIRIFAGEPPSVVQRTMSDRERSLLAGITKLQGRAPVAALGGIVPILRRFISGMEEMRRFNQAVGSLQAIQRIPAARLNQVWSSGTKNTAVIMASLAADQATIESRLDRASAQYEQRAARASLVSTIGAGIALILLGLAFAVAYRRAAAAQRRARALAAEAAELASAHREQALTDSLTGLRNRRALTEALEYAIDNRADDESLLLVLFDLDGFKDYNDSFGHGAGDALLARLAGRLRETVEGIGVPYRMGGDEFCLLGRVDGDGSEAIARLAGAALSDAGDGFSVGCSYGYVHVPEEASTASEALRLADIRMYEQKTAGRQSAGRQSTDVLIQVLAEQHLGVEKHLTTVARLAEETAQRLELPTLEIARIRLAAELHDIGKTAIPEAILSKPGPLDAEEWEFVRRHTIIGERIAAAAPALAHATPLIRSSHERIDGKGYPDGLAGDQIPLGARIIAVCDAFDAMVSGRPYVQPRPIGDAVAELRRCAGTQFDERIVELFCHSVTHDDEYSHLHSQS